MAVVARAHTWPLTLLTATNDLRLRPALARDASQLSPMRRANEDIGPYRSSDEMTMPAKVGIG